MTSSFLPPGSSKVAKPHLLESASRAGRNVRNRLGTIIGAVLLSVAAATACAVPAVQTRCGWYVAPTPGNLWLTDRDATWVITSQGQAQGPDAAGTEHAPAFDRREFVETNVPGTGYGYGCACLVVDIDDKTRRITRIHSGRMLLLRQCRRDKSLPLPMGG